MKKIISFLLSLLILCLVALGGAYFYVYSQVQPINKTEKTESLRIEVHNGDTVRKVASVLKEKELIKNDRFFYLFASRPQFLKYFIKSEKYSQNGNFILKSGIYYVDASMNYFQIYDLLSSGRQEFITVSIPEGWTMLQIGTLLEEKDICSKKEFLEICKNPEFLEKNKIPLELGSAEGYLFPDTYFFIPKSSAVSIAQELISNFYKKIGTLIDINTVTPEELSKTVILASIVEREYKVKKEAPLIASVFKNRIRIGMGLQSCATVMYIITDIMGKPHQSGLTEEDTRIDNLYNTYKWAGLTPGPISNPGLTALDASINTPKTKYYFFVYNSNKNDGTHLFTSTFDEHKDTRRKLK